MAINKQILIDIKKKRITDIHTFIQLYIKTEKYGDNGLIAVNIAEANLLIQDFLDSIDFLKKNRIVKLKANQKKQPNLFEKLKDGNVQKFFLLSYRNSCYNQVDISIMDMKLIKRYIKYSVISNKDYGDIIRHRIMIFLTIFIPVLIFIVGYVIYKSKTLK